MARAVAADERIGLAVETSYDGSGIQEARQDTGSLAREAKAASAQLAAATNEQATSQRGLNGVLRESAQATEQVKISSEKLIELERQAMGDQTKLIQLLQQYRQEQLSLAAATRERAAAERDQAAAAPTVAARPASIPPAELVTKVSTEIDKIPTKARTAANALSTLAFAAADGGGSLRGLTIAAGTMTDAIVVLSGSARVAASAAGIGALVTVLATVLSLLERSEDKARSAGEAFKGKLGDLSDSALEAKFRTLDTAFVNKAREIADKGWFQLGRDNLNRLPGESAQGDLEKLEAQRSVTLEEIMRRRRDANRRQAQADEDQRKRDAITAQEAEEELSFKIETRHLQRLNKREALDNLAADREFTRRREEIESLMIDEDEKTKLLELAYKVRMDAQVQAHLDAAMRINAIEEKLFQEQQARTERSLEILKNQMEQALHSAVTGSESFISAVTKMMLTPVIRRLEALAVSEGIEALVELAFGDFIRAGQHAAVASAAVLAAQKVARMAGLTAGGGASGAIAGGPALSARDPSKAPTNVTVVIQTINPFSKEIIGETTYELQRAGILKNPVYAPPARRAG